VLIVGTPVVEAGGEESPQELLFAASAHPEGGAGQEWSERC
jgi:hypothetical protein